jgi:hypothetical protein
MKKYALIALIGTGLFAGCQKTETKMWEYKVISQRAGNQDSLDKLGEERWELVAVVPAIFESGSHPNSIVNTVYLYFKRAK